MMRKILLYAALASGLGMLLLSVLPAQPATALPAKAAAPVVRVVATVPAEPDLSRQVAAARGTGAATVLHEQALREARIYRNPFRDVHHLQAERIDMGVDYGGYGRVFALGPGVIVDVWCCGWPGGAFISERLTAGPHKGRYVYLAEDVTPWVHVGEHVTASNVLGRMWGGIETGWAAAPGNNGETVAAALGEWDWWDSTWAGWSYSCVLHRHGAPRGLIEGHLR